jgi:hypothetical protein
MLKVILREKLPQFVAIVLVGSVFIGVSRSVSPRFGAFVIVAVGGMLSLAASAYELSAPRRHTALLLTIALGFCLLLGAGSTMWHLFVCRFTAIISDNGVILCDNDNIKATLFSTLSFSILTVLFWLLNVLVRRR